MASPPDDAPYYFMSYAHTPSARGRNGKNPDKRIVKFHQDLGDLIMELTDLPNGAIPGFLDEEMDTGVQWREELLFQINRCRVFLPMLSRRYFTSDWTCKEWYAFSQRPIRGAAAEHNRHTGVLAVTWAEYQREVVPAAIRNTQAFRPETFGQHADLLTLVTLPNLEGEYWEAVNKIARVIVRTAETVDLGPSPFTRLADLDREFKRSELYRAVKGSRK